MYSSTRILSASLSARSLELRVVEDAGNTLRRGVELRTAVVGADHAAACRQEGGLEDAGEAELRR